MRATCCDACQFIMRHSMKKSYALSPFFSLRVHHCNLGGFSSKCLSMFSQNCLFYPFLWLPNCRNRLLWRFCFKNIIQFVLLQWWNNSITYGNRHLALGIKIFLILKQAHPGLNSNQNCKNWIVNFEQQNLIGKIWYIHRRFLISSIVNLRLSTPNK